MGLFLLGAAAPAQNVRAAAATPGAPMPPQQLDDLVAPIALYPDPLVGEVLAASTYPIEIAEADQWARDHPHWKPSKLMDEAKKQKWDPSVQGLVAFPNVLAYLTQNTGWITQLGNAFLAQQADVMQAVQRMRAKAQAKGMLQSTPQETVTTQNQNGQSAISIQPADPNLWYVPNYNPAYVWGPPDWGVYPPLAYPGIDVGFGWGAGVDLGLSFGGWGGWGWGGWGWSPNWYGGGIFIDNSFFHRYGFRNFGPAGLAIPCGCTIRITDSAGRMPIATWPPAFRAVVLSPAGSARTRNLIAGRSETSSAWEARSSNSAALRAITASSVVITTAECRACKATMAFPAWARGGRSADSVAAHVLADSAAAARCLAAGGDST